MARCGCDKTCNCLVEAVDTNCIKTDVMGIGTPTNPYVIKATPVIDPNTENGLSCGAAGLLSIAKVHTANTDCAHLTGDGTVATPLTATPVISPAAGNIISCTPQGLFASDTETTVVAHTDTPCIHLSGDGGVTPLQADIVTDPASPTPITCGPNGLTVAAACHPVPITVETVQDGSPCISSTGDGCTTPLNIKLGISPDPCNGVVCHGNGLFVKQDLTPIPPQQLNCANYHAGPFTGTFLDMVIDGPFCVSLTNPSACKPLNVLGRMSGVTDVSQQNGMFVVGFQVSTTGLGGPWVTTSQAGALSGGAYGGRFTLIWPGDLFTIAPGGTMTLCFRVVASGTAVINGVVGNSDRCGNVIPQSWTE